MNKYIIEHGLVGRSEYAVSGCETIEDLREYLSTNPHPQYRLVSCQWLSGNYLLVWELEK
jgi:hypothetical protein